MSSGCTFEKFLLLILVSCCWCENSGQWLQRTALEQNYDKFKRPDAHGATDVLVSFYIESIGNFLVTSMDFDVDIYFIMTWNDHRLRHESNESMNFNDRKILEGIWIPDLYFSNSKSAAYNNVIVPNFRLVINSNGDVRYAERIALKLSCNMDLKVYPFDKQQCFMKILSYGHTIEKLNVTWKLQSPVETNHEIVHTDLNLTNISTDYCSGVYFSHTYSCLLAKFYLERMISLSVMQVYVPSTAIVSISWISFWIDPNSVPGRVGLAVTTLLTLSTQAAAITFRLPPVGYAKAVDYWLGLCLLFLFAALIEFTMANTYIRYYESASRKRDILIKKQLKGGENEEDCDNGTTLLKGHKLSRLSISDPSRYRKKAIGIDRISRVLFPVAFALFAIVYWTVYFVKF